MLDTLIKLIDVQSLMTRIVGYLPNFISALLLLIIFWIANKTIQKTLSAALTRVEVGGQSMAAGESLFMLWGSANRDEAAFPDADRLVLDRHPNRHLTFGIGGHRCLGATLARTEMKVVLSEVLARMPDYRIDEDGLRHPETIGIVYGLTAEPATFSPGPRLG